MTTSHTTPDWELVYPLANPLFWVLAVLITTFWIATTRSAAARSPSNEKSEPEYTVISWLHPYLTNSPRIVFAIIIYVLILGLALFEGWWVLQVDWQVFRNLLAGPRPGEEGSTLSYLLATGLCIVFTLGTIFVGFMIVCSVVHCIAELVLFLDGGSLEKEGLMEGDLGEEESVRPEEEAKSQGLL